MAGAIDGIAAVENRTLAGKIIVYPMLHDLGLIPLSRLDETLPAVAAKLGARGSGPRPPRTNSSGRRAIGGGGNRPMAARGGRDHARAGKTFVGFGFGPIQSALFLFEAFQSGNFSRYVVAEVDAVARARRSGDNGGGYTINIARPDRIEQVTVEGVELYNPATPSRPRAARRGDRRGRRAGHRAAQRQLLRRRRAELRAPACSPRGFAAPHAPMPTVIYAAENHNHAAEILAEKVAPLRAAGRPATDVQILNTVIGKMSGVITDARRPSQRMRLGADDARDYRARSSSRSSTASSSRGSTLPGFRRGIEVFVEKDDLLPFEEAKLYGHNAIHALIGYLADLRGLPTMADAGRDAGIMAHRAGGLPRRIRRRPDPTRHAGLATRSSRRTATATTPTTCSTAWSART